MSGPNGTQSPGGNVTNDPATPGNPTTPPAAPQAGQPVAPQTPPTPQAPAADDNEPITLEKARELRRENQTLRGRSTTAEQERDALKAQLAEIERGKLSELERAKLDAQAAKDQVEAARKTLAEAALSTAAAKLGMIDPTDAAPLLAQIKYNASGLPENAEELVRAYVAGKPHLIDARRIAGSPANPGQGTSNAPGTFRASQLADIDFWDKNKVAIEQAMKEGRIIKDL